MVFRERRPLNPEREALLSGNKFSRNVISTVNWKSVSIGLIAGLIPFVLWVAIFQNYNDPTVPLSSDGSNALLRQASMPPSSSNHFASDTSTDSKTQYAPVLKSINNSPNWKKISTKKFRRNRNSSVVSDPVHDPTEFGVYRQPTFANAGNKTIASYHMVVTKGVISPDGFPQPAYLINGQSPGPEIRVKQNSILIVRVTNKLDRPITFHFHGIHQRKSFMMDGVPHVTQDPIPPGGSFTYKMNLWPQVGTFFYHAHTGMDIVWLFGPLIIEDTPDNYSNYPQEYQYDDDKVFILNGIYHQELDNLVERIVGPIHDYPGLISSVTINGRSFGEWTNVISGELLSAPSACGYDITSVKHGLTYRFRFINAASDSLLYCNISNHKFHIIEMDGIYTEPVETDHVAISPGQRYSLIINMTQLDDNYFIQCRHMESPGPLNGLAVLNYLNATTPNKEMLEFYRNGTSVVEMDRWIIDDLVPNHSLNQTDFYKVPIKVDKEYVIDVFEAVWGQRHVYLLNGHYYQDPEVPYFRQLKNGINITEIPQVYELVEGETIQFIFQNQRTGNFCFSHPWHIHGHSFHVVGEGPNKYDPVVDGPRIQRDVESGKKFQFRDAVAVYGNQTVGEFTDGAYCGWAAVRFPAHNNGLWLAHCHVTPHLVMGKKFVIWEHSKEDPMLTELMSTKYNYNLPGEPGGW